MKTKLWSLMVVTLFLVTIPFVTVSTQDEEILEEEPIDIEQLEEEEPLPTIMATLKEVGDLDTLIYFLQKTELNKKLNDGGTYTLFAPTDSAFAKLTKMQLDSIINDQTFTRNLLSRHMVEGKAVFFDEDGNLEIEMSSGDKIKISVTEDYVKVGNATIIEEGIECSNGVIHVIDAVIMTK